MAAETEQADSVVNNLSFSVDSLQIGDSTRSLLSPLYDNDRESLREEKRYNSDDEELSEGEIVDKSTSSESSSDGHSETVTVKKAKSKRSVSEGREEESDSLQRSSKSYSSSSSSSSTPNKSQGRESDTETLLSPWEKWLLTKVIKDNEKAKIKTKKKLLNKEIIEKEIAEKLDNEKKAEMKRKEWLELKNREEKIRNKLKRREENEKACKEQEEKERVQEKADNIYKKWFEMKEGKRREIMKNKRMEEQVKKKNESDRGQRSSEAYQEWFEKAKTHQKSTNNHFGYLSGRVTGYYDWTCYPMPSYNNPNPWVSPKVKKKYRGKLELQNPSPPLLFKEIAERERIMKQKYAPKIKKNNKGVL